jgi:hypothetical protein
MTEHLSSSTIEGLTGRQLAPADLIKATTHLASCALCQEKTSEAASAISGMKYLRTELQRSSAAGVHPEYDQLEAYIDDTLTLKAREELKRHLAECGACLQESLELESLRDNLQSYPITVQGQPISRKAQDGYWRSVAAFFQLRPRQLASLTAVVVLVAVFAVLLIRRQSRQQIAGYNPTPAGNVAKQNNEIAKTNGNTPKDDRAKPTPSVEAIAASPYESIIAQTIVAQKIATPTAIRDLTGPESKLLGSAEPAQRFALLSPVGTVVRNSRPTFRWHQLAGATSYGVAILDQDLNLVEKNSPSPQLSWAPTHPLKRDVVYTWQVTAVFEGREITAPAAPAREARFKIISAEKAAALSRTPPEISTSHLKLGIVYAHSGLLDDAEREWRAAIAAGQDAVLARKLLLSTKQIRR